MIETSRCQRVNEISPASQRYRCPAVRPPQRQKLVVSDAQGSGGGQGV